MNTFVNHSYDQLKKLAQYYSYSANQKSLALILITISVFSLYSFITSSFYLNELVFSELILFIYLVINGILLLVTYNSILLYWTAIFSVLFCMLASFSSIVAVIQRVGPLVVVQTLIVWIAAYDSIRQIQRRKAYEIDFKSPPDKGERSEFMTMIKGMQKNEKSSGPIIAFEIRGFASHQKFKMKTYKDFVLSSNKATWEETASVILKRDIVFDRINPKHEKGHVEGNLSMNGRSQKIKIDFDSAKRLEQWLENT